MTALIILGAVLAIGIIGIFLVVLLPTGRHPTIAADQFYTSPTRGMGAGLLGGL